MARAHFLERLFGAGAFGMAFAGDRVQENLLQRGSLRNILADVDSQAGRLASHREYIGNTVLAGDEGDGKHTN